MKTMTGKIQLNAFLDTLMDKERNFIKYFPTDTKFKFTDGVEVTVTEKDFTVAEKVFFFFQHSLSENDYE